MNWYNYIACFFAGAFLSNFIPHFIKGVTGEKFPTPFARPPGRGLSSPFLNVLWGLMNLIIGLILVWHGKVFAGGYLSIIIFFIGFSLLSILLSIFALKKHKE